MKENFDGYWDDGNFIDGDGCDSSCKTEKGFIWFTDLPGGYIDVWRFLWGDGVTLPIETDPDHWDDGDNYSGDGWSEDCKVEPGYIWTRGSLTERSVWSLSCGNGIKDGEDECDDQNRDNHDGCSRNWTIEPGFTCEFDSSVSHDNWFDTWGDGILVGNLNPFLFCDDGNKVSGDGWDDKCQVEQYWKCSGGNQTHPSVCEPVWGVENWLKWADTDDQKWVFWDKGFTLQDNYTWTAPEVSQAVKEMGSATNIVSGAAGSAAFGISLMTLSSPMAIWFLAHQFQLYLLLLLTKTSLPVDVSSYIKGNGFFSFSMDFLPIKDSSVYKGNFEVLLFNNLGIENLLHKEQPKEGLEEMGLESLSSLSNNIGLMIVILLFTFVHGIVIWFSWNTNIREKSSKITFVSKVFKAMYKHFTFGVYIRFFLEAFQFIVIGSFSEIYNLDVSSSKRIISIWISLLFFLFSFAIFLLSCSYLFKSINDAYDNKKHDKFQEFNSGLKKWRVARLYTPLLLLRRYLFILWLIWLNNHHTMLIVIGMLLIQIAYFGCLLSLRPAAEQMNNWIEAINEAIYTLMLGFLTHVNSEDKWTSSMSSIFIWIMLSNSLIIWGILIGNCGE